MEATQWETMHVEARHDDARMFDEIVMGLAALGAKIGEINARPMPFLDLNYAEAELKARPAKVRKRFDRVRATKLSA
ncbi:hypothetical protein FHT82_006027 [Rhizobium sp. BK275]|uniref:hypothetical protein n=1 Tax=unclassified Rhizobium TaxID=2613769 RepID=UPI001858D5B9|nr:MULTISPECIES: hypothetical protein [unclassified Rhizobium]MBB3393234.1 hypothetical protein [Rhizobium sp. BK275]MBB3409746.1 hypothetical protein [Rhizobium sp. BK316]